MYSLTPISNIMEQNIFWLQKIKCSPIQKVSFPTCVSPKTAFSAHFVCVSKKGIKMNVALILWTLMSSWFVQLWGVNNSWEGGCPLQFLREFCLWSNLLDLRFPPFSIRARFTVRGWGRLLCGLLWKENSGISCSVSHKVSPLPLYWGFCSPRDFISVCSIGSCNCWRG